MPDLLLASNNQGKVCEYRVLLGSTGYRLFSLAERGITEEVPETGDTYEQNARLKALAYARTGQLVAVADDSGLEVDALDGEPGVRSARFAGENISDAEKIKTILNKLQGVLGEERTARFICVIAIATPEGEVELCRGECPGMIAFEPAGEGGFGYDPIFYLPDLGKTMAEVSQETKNRVSHRARAAQIACQVLKEKFH